MELILKEYGLGIVALIGVALTIAICAAGVEFLGLAMSDLQSGIVGG